MDWFKQIEIAKKYGTSVVRFSKKDNWWLEIPKEAIELMVIKQFPLNKAQNEQVNE